MAHSIFEDSAQDEVCVELWDVLQHAKGELKNEFADPQIDKQRADDLIYLMSRAGSSYRYHAEYPRIALASTTGPQA